MRSVAQMAALAAQAASVNLPTQGTSVNFNQEDAPCSNLNVDDPMLWGAAFPCEFMPNSEGTDYPSAYNTKMIRKRKPHEDSLMNIANTIAYANDRKKLCNAEVILSKSGKFAMRAKRDIQPNEFIWVDYGKWNNKHNWKIQYEICKARLMLLLIL